ncbi:MAG: hypothetical protein K8R53_06160 [Bacteroidales bacterium]|nr:hypothetical protein [Bacteroidales bacterium]
MKIYYEINKFLWILREFIYINYYFIFKAKAPILIVLKELKLWWNYFVEDYDWIIENGGFIGEY